MEATRPLESDPRLLLGVDDPDLAPRLLLALDYACENASALRERLAASLQRVKARLDDMGGWLALELGEIASGRVAPMPTQG